MLMLNTDLSADEAWENGLVKELLDTCDFTEQVTKKVQAIARMPAKVSKRTCNAISLLVVGTPTTFYNTRLLHS